MTPQFSKAVDPIFLHVLDLLDRISKDEEPNPEEEKLRIRRMLEDAHAQTGGGPEWEIARYALVSWIDEMLIDAPWQGKSWWNENVLEIELFQTRICYTEFYVKAKEAAQLPKRDALEVCYVCVVLGFRGMYRDPTEAALNTQAYGLPSDLDTWAKQTALAIKLGQGRPPITPRGGSGAGAPPLTGQSFVVWTSLIGVVLAAFTAMYGLLFLSQ